MKRDHNFTLIERLHIKSLCIYWTKFNKKWERCKCNYNCL